MNLWKNFVKPIVGLAPMDGVTDYVYREIQSEVAKPDVTITEFIAVEGIVRMSEGLLADFWYSAKQRPVIAQIYGNDPQLFYAAAQLACELGFDGVDINMGCPAKSVVHRGCGAGLIRTPELAKDIITATKHAVEDWYTHGINWEKWPLISGSTAKSRYLRFLGNTKSLGVENIYDDMEKINSTRRLIPVSVKTRIGFDIPVTEEWIKTIAGCDIAAIAIHGRTLKQSYSGNSNWEEIRIGVDAAKSVNSEIIVLGNGDIKDLHFAREVIANSNVDGVLVGRGTWGNPWLISEIKQDRELTLTLDEKFEVMLTHARLHEKTKPNGFVQMRKNLAWYISGIPGAAALRSELVRAKDAGEVARIISNYGRISPSTNIV